MQKDTSKLSPDYISFAKAYRAALIWAAFILFLCLLPGDDLPDIDFWEINIEDKLAHISVFAILCILMFRGASERSGLKNNYKRSVITIVLTAILFGTLTEWLQGFVTTGRYPSLSDALADTIGVIIGMFLSIAYFKIGKKPKI